MFLMCELSKSDPHYPKYPPLPVLRCAGFEKLADNREHDEAR